MANPNSLINDAPEARIRQERIQSAELEKALALHDTLIRLQPLLKNLIGRSQEHLSAFAPFLREDVIPWPQMGDLKNHIECVDNHFYWHLDEAEQEHSAIMNDLAIWIVERHYRPASPAEVCALRPPFQKAGLGFVLYRCFEQHRGSLIAEQHKCFQLLFEHWIDSVWDDEIELPLPESVRTVGELVAWLEDTGPVLIPAQVAQVIEEIKNVEM
ncbi:MAG TPA: hypothetical protein VKW06_11535 [Candidatus Angelobacter sp.]|nr:hypothetical protein [Candidatus Angelobacter sp.]